VWEVMPHFVLRTTGFPLELIDGLAFSAEVMAAIEAVLDAEDNIATTRRRLANAAPRGSAPEGLRREMWKAARRGETLPADFSEVELGDALRAETERWNEAVHERDRALKRARQSVEAEVEESRHRLRRIVVDPRFQEAVWLSSPDMLDRAVSWYLRRPTSVSRSNRVRSVERQLVAYLQRFCAKNDTASFFGPVAYGSFDGDGDGRWPRAAAGERVAGREAFVAHWAANEMARRIAAEPELRPYLALRRHPACRFDGVAEAVRLPDGRSVALAGAAARIVELVDGRNSGVAISAALGKSVEDTMGLVERLARAHVITVEGDVPVTENRALTWLRGWLATLPRLPARDRWEGLLGKVEEMRREFEVAGLPRRRELLDRIEETISSATGSDPRRRAGEIYADRLVLHEECLGAVSPMRLSVAAGRRIAAALDPVLDTYAAHALDQLAADRELACRLLGASGSEPRPLLDALVDLAGTEEAPALVPSARVSELRRLVAAHAADGEVCIDPDRLPPPPPGFAKESLIASPDVMIAAANPGAFATGEGQIIVSECHDTLAVSGWALALHPSPEQVRRSARELLDRLPATDEVRANLPPSRRTKIVPLQLPGPVIDLRGTVPESPERLPVSELSVSVEDGRPCLLTSDGQRLRLYNGELATFSHRVLALPRVVRPVVDTGPHTPRVRIGEAIVQREQWRLPAPELLGQPHRGDVFGLLLDAGRSRRRLGLPRRVYVRAPGEPKPVYLDFHNPFLLELVEHLGGEGELTLTEMLPEPEDLWLRDEQQSFSAELRLSAAWVESG
jgi:Lantibiotic dehydratase, N terminus